MFLGKYYNIQLNHALPIYFHKYMKSKRLSNLTLDELFLHFPFYNLISRQVVNSDLQ